MAYKIDITPHDFHFKKPATTSRGVYNTRRSWLVRITDTCNPDRSGVGECAPLPDLSCDACPDYYEKLTSFCRMLECSGEIPYEAMKNYPSMLFGIETAMWNLERGSTALSDTDFARGTQGITINGLIWMGHYRTMLEQLEEKFKAGFHCIKLKIGAIDFDDELSLMQMIRDRYDVTQVQLRVDANGAFTPYEALDKLKAISRYDIHSIEQPIRQGQYDEMARLCQLSPVDIALDEELIGINDTVDKNRLLETIKPQYIILKPSLHGGIRGVKEWIDLAKSRGIGSWITSALESNIGLNAIAHLVAEIYGSSCTMPQGLGTGMLFTDNIPIPLQIKGEKLWYTAQ